MLEKDELLAPLARLRSDEVVVTTMSAVRPWSRWSDSDLDFASADSAMGHAADLALGIAMARPDRRVWCLNGDGSMLMSLGTLATIVASGVRNLLLVICDNGTYEITGNQRVPGAGVIGYSAMARAAGFARAYTFHDGAAWADAASEVVSAEGPVLVHAAVTVGDEGPITRGSHEAARYLQVSLRDWARVVRSALEG